MTETKASQQPNSAFAEIMSRHPCFGRTPVSFGRLHLPVAPTCNLACRFCSRGLDDSADRPGVAGRFLQPEEAPAVVERALGLCPEVTVVGVAGPGDALASDHALKALRYVHKRFPFLIKCLSTNGLLLAEKIEEVVEVGVRALTVTVNAVDPEIVSEITPRIAYGRESYQGRAGARILIENQLSGITLAALNGMVVKVNTVLIPGVNSDHVGEVAQIVALAGAARINIIPLIPQSELINEKPPSCSELQRARKAAEQYLPVFRHCQQCRADAVGKLGGRDYRLEVYGDLAVPATFSHG